MGQVIDFYGAVHTLQRPPGWILDVYDVHFKLPDGRPTVWTLTVRGEDQARKRVKEMWGDDCQITNVRCVGYARAPS